ncbi:hypothetical protein [Citreimonas salinaria]|uniref:Helix-turn-helix domain-containing protein n=1 Tax=Citreimonas salinaria TaxID=321339 RepID=A0A1H3KNR4_9RHOB|nr:hypothetical protein [Citreimonas salinaria]SDY53817.1 hypothetical protein SAMN05444340_11018 [Citreimonas salinaria]
MTKTDRWFSSPTQVYWCCKALIEGRSISHKTEIREVRGWRLAAICERLRKQYHWPILTEYRGPENTAYYRLAPGTDLTKLRYPASARALADEVAR